MTYDPNRTTLARAYWTCEEAIGNCERSGNTEAKTTWKRRLQILKRYLPSGSGFDKGTAYEGMTGTGDKATDGLCFRTWFHHMTEDGVYDSWTEHPITVRPAWDDLDISIRGPNYRRVKDHIHEAMHEALTSEVLWSDVDAEIARRLNPATDE